MPFSIALAGKGGTGKTTLAGLLVKYLIMNEKIPVLAVDADSNANFNEVLGVKEVETLGDARENMKRGNVPNGMTKDVFIEMKVEEAVVESEGFDLVVMGQPEGAGCYCAANTLLTNFMDRLQGNYPYVVMDNEAGMEHISRLTTHNVDVLLVVTDTSRRSLQAAVRIGQLASELNIGVDKILAVINQCREEPSDVMIDILKKGGLEIAGMIPEDPTVYEYDLKGLPTIQMPPDTRSVKAAFDIYQRIVA